MARVAALVLLSLWALACSSCAPTLNPDADTPSASRSATTYHVRPDGGSTGQCTGLVDAPYPGTGSDQPCAW
ncbi:MAG TPA: hypothetical protein VLC95_14685, partial [Anaerolineae bacterium]|nr:hypothetical protein [Anaerolineae bacterium]